MKKIMAIILCAAFLVLPLPGLTQAADNPAKAAFIANFATLMTNSAKMQESISQDIAKNTVNISIKADLAEANGVLSSGTKVSNVPGHFDANMAFNLTTQKAGGTFQGNLDKYAVKGQFYLTKDGLIITRETAESIARLDGDILGNEDIDKLPPYIVFPLDAEASKMIQEMSKAYTDGPKQTQAVIDFMKEVFTIIPDSCYSYDGGEPVLDLNLNILASKELISNLKAHSSSLADKIAVIYEASSTSQPLGKNFKQDIVDEINQMSVEKMNDLLKDAPFSLSEFRFTSLPDQLKAGIGLAVKDHGDTVGFTLKSDEKVSATNSSSKASLQMKLDIPDDVKMDLTFTIDGTSNLKKADYGMVLSGNIKDEDGIYSGKIKGNISMDWSNTSPVDVPALTPQNSKVIKLEPPRRSDASRSNGISIVIDGEDMYFEEADPVMLNGRAMIPLKDMAEYFGCQVKWQAPGTIILIDDEDSVTMTINSTKYKENNQVMTMDAAPRIINGHTYVPVAFIADYFGFDAEWDPKLQAVYLDSL